MKNNVIRALCAIFAAILLMSLISATAVFADEPDPGFTTGAAPEPPAETGSDGISAKAIAAAVAVGLAAAAGAIGMGIAIAKSTDSMARQPEASGKINSALMLGLVFIETAILYGLIVAILIIFVM